MRTPTGRDFNRDDLAHRQLARLAQGVIERSPDELSDIVDANPALVGEWMAELRQHRDGLESEVRDLDAALLRLLAARGKRGRSAA